MFAHDETAGDIPVKDISLNPSGAILPGLKKIQAEHKKILFAKCHYQN